MKLLLVLAILGSTGCASIGQRCESLAPASKGWSPVPIPPEAALMLASISEPPGAPVRWYQGVSGQYRAVSCAPCSGVAYQFVQVNGRWEGDVDALSYCH